MIIKQILKFLCTTFLLILMVACDSKKDSFEYASFCPNVPDVCKNLDGTESSCTNNRVFEGLEKNHAGCTYLKIPSVLKVDVNFDYVNIKNLPLKVLLPKSEALLKYDYIPETIIRNGHKAIILNYIKSFPKVPMTKYANLDVYIQYKSATYAEMFPEFPDKLGPKGAEMRYAFDMSVVNKDKTAVIKCSETSNHKLNLNNVNPMCRLTSLVAKNLLLSHYIPFETVPHFEELHRSYNVLFSSFIVKLETKGN